MDRRLEDEEDLRLAEKRLHEVRAGKAKTSSLPKVTKRQPKKKNPIDRPR